MMHGTSHSLGREEGEHEEGGQLSQPKTMKYNELDQIQRRGALWAKEFLEHYTEGLYYTKHAGSNRRFDQRHTFGRKDFRESREEDGEAGDKDERDVLTRNIVFMELQP